MFRGGPADLKFYNYEIARTNDHETTRREAGQKEEPLMRLRKFTALLLFALAVSLPVCEKLLPGFLATGQGVASLTAPLNVVASDGAYSTKIGVSWDAVRGATAYRVFRNTANDPATAVSVGTTVEGSFFDAAAAGVKPSFWVRAGKRQRGQSLSALRIKVCAQRCYRPLVQSRR